MPAYTGLDVYLTALADPPEPAVQGAETVVRDPILWYRGSTAARP